MLTRRMIVWRTLKAIFTIIFACNVFVTDNGNAEESKLVSAGIKFQRGLWEFSRIDYFTRSRDDPTFKIHAMLFHNCYFFLFARFYSEFKKEIDGIDISSIHDEYDIRKSQNNNSIIRDPKKIAAEVLFSLGALQQIRGYKPPLKDFAANYGNRQDLIRQCEPYIRATGLQDK